MTNDGIEATLLTIIGAVFAGTSAALGIWNQFALPGGGNIGQHAYFRLSIALGALAPVGIGLLILSAGRILAAIQRRSTSS